jgi:hypothetical protein
MFYICDNTGARQGTPVSREQLQELANQGKINPQTRLEDAMATWHYVDNAGMKQGPFTDEQIEELIAKRVVVQQTILETLAGHHVLAVQVRRFQQKFFPPPMHSDAERITTPSLGYVLKLMGLDIEQAHQDIKRDFDEFVQIRNRSPGDAARWFTENSPLKMAVWKIFAKYGCAEAQVFLASDLSAMDDFAGAASWLRKSAEQGNAFAAFQLGGFYIRGIGVPQDASEAVKWFKKSRDNGFGIAGDMLEHLASNGIR